MSKHHPNVWDYYYSKIHAIENHIRTLRKTYERRPQVHQDLIDFWEDRVADYKEKINTMKQKT